MEPATHKQSRRPRRNPLFPKIGGIFLALALVGVIAIGMGSVQLTRRLLDNSGEVEKLQTMLRPVLMFDPVPFENVESADPMMLLQSSLWSALYSDKRESYTYDENNMLIIPVSDVDVAAAKLFGPTAKLEHQTFGDLDNNYIYDEENQVYKVPLMAQGGYYTPYVENITKNGDLLDLKVGYVSPSSPWYSDTSGKNYQPKPDKYMIYQVKKVKDSYYIVALRDPGEAAESSSGS